MVFLISVELFLIVYNKYTEIYFFLKVRLLNMLSQVFIALTDLYNPFFMPNI